jgi:protein KRI1
LLQGEAGSASSEEENYGADQRTKSIAYNKEQQDLRKNLLKSLKKANAAESSDDEEDILKVKKKTPEEEEAEKAALKNVLDEVLAVNNDEAPSKDKFLYDYMLNKKWNFPTNHIGSRVRGDDGSENGLVEEDEEEIEREENFESKYNFRFEELQGASSSSAAGGGGPVTVTGHSRAVDGSVRRVDDKRKKAREARKERKEKERRQKEAELRRLKNLKRQEVLRCIFPCFQFMVLKCDCLFVQLQEKLEKIMKVGGLDAMTAETIMLDADALDDDWDPVKHEVSLFCSFVIST